MSAPDLADLANDNLGAARCRAVREWTRAMYKLGALESFFAADAPAVSQLLADAATKAHLLADRARAELEEGDVL